MPKDLFTKEQLEKERLIFILVNDRSYSENSIKAIQYLLSRFNEKDTYNFEMQLSIADTSQFRELGLPDWKGSFLPYVRFFPNAIEQLQGHKRALFLDCDMICYSDIRELFALDLGEAAVAGVWDLLNCTARSICSREKLKKGDEILKAEKIFNTSDPRFFGEYLNRTDYFNAGFLLYDLENFEKYKIGQKALKVAIENVCIYPEQEALAVALSGHSLVLPPSFNAVNANIYSKRNAISCADGIFGIEECKNEISDSMAWLQKELKLPFTPLKSDFIQIQVPKNYLKIELNEALHAPKIVHLVRKPEVNLCEDFAGYYSGFAAKTRKPINELYYFWLKNFFPQN